MFFIIWGIALFLIFLIIKNRQFIWAIYRSIIIWWLVNKAKRKLIALGKKDMANDIKWDEKWY